MATAININETINEALTILNTYDWWWSLGHDYAYTNGIRTAMQMKMRRFVALAAKCCETICNALRELWSATYTIAHKDWMFCRTTDEDKAQYEAVRAKLMAIIQPDNNNIQ